MYKCYIFLGYSTFFVVPRNLKKGNIGNEKKYCYFQIKLVWEYEKQIYNSLLPSTIHRTFL